MSEIPAPLPPANPPAASSPRLGWPGWIAWGVILLVSGFLMLAAAKPELRGRESTNSVGDFQITIAAKNVMGVKTMAALVQNTTTQPTTVASTMGLEAEPMLAQIDTLATTPSQRLKAAIVSAEVRGREEALRRVNEIAAEAPPSDLEEDIGALRTIYTAGPSEIDQPQRQHLLEHQGYTGKLALTFGAGASDGLREEVIAEGRRMLILNMVILAAGLVAILGGLAMFILAIVLLLSGSIKRLYDRQPGAGSVYLEMFAVWLLTYVVLSLLISVIAGHHPSLEWTWLVGISLPLAFGWGILRGVRWNEMRHALGWHGGRGWYIEIPMGLVGYFAGLPIIAMGAGITILLVSLSGSKPSHPIMNEPTTSVLAILGLYGIASVFAPIVEETVFRGALFHHLRSRWNWVISSTIVATIFAAIHPQGWALIPALASIAIVLAGIREWRGSLLGCITAHAFHNAMLVTLLVLSK